MWKGGSGARWLPPLPVDPRDPRMHAETSIFSNPSVTFGHFARKAFTKKAPKPQKVASRVDETPTCSEGIVPGVGPNESFFPRCQLLATLPSLLATCSYLNPTFLSGRAGLFQYIGPRTPPGRSPAARPPPAAPGAPGRPPNLLFSKKRIFYYGNSEPCQPTVMLTQNLANLLLC